MTGESPDLEGIVRRVDDEIRRRGAIGDTFGDGPQYTSDGRDGHDDYDCAAADRRALLALLREAEDVLDRLIPYTLQAVRYIDPDAAGLIDDTRAVLRKANALYDRLAAVVPVSQP